MTHLKRLAAPRSWAIRRKERKYIMRPSPGPHGVQGSLPLGVVLKGFLRLAVNTREVKRIVTGGKVMVDGRVIRDHRFPVGLMDVVDIPEVKKRFVVVYDERGRFSLREVAEGAERVKVCKVRGKTKVRGGKTQVNLFDGKNFLVGKDEVKVDDSVVVELPTLKVVKHLPLQKGCTIYLVGGKHAGVVGVLEEVKRFKSIEEDRIIVKAANERIETLKRYAFVVEEDFQR